ncbi:hypothetical protein CCACVL1_27095 [Corchorus capsularis]|uniref:Uncharacterized protein n=1 Tax=Corchorus capsularis TaxID=210143 RepID=A0A1R3GC48_COCAP|nr:hypothetical protein CCACVL1_27095 [Corchorus capsularis]
MSWLLGIRRVPVLLMDRVGLYYHSPGVSTF